MRRGFSKKEKRAAFLLTNGKSAISGQELKDDFEGDHILAFSKGGTTDMSNIQPVTKQENRNKGAGISLREWQSNALQALSYHDGQVFNLEVVYGAGKTLFGVLAALKLKTPSDLIFILAPTIPIRNSWVHKFHENGQEIDCNWSGNYLNPEFQGVALTYAALRGLVPNIKALQARGFRIILILDECHHNGADRATGKYIEEAFSQSRKILNLSGTFFRHDDSIIHGGILSKDNTYECHFEYSYLDALRANIVRPCKFDLLTCTAEILDASSGATFGVDSFMAGDTNKLGYLVESDGVVEQFVQACHNEIEYKRKLKPDAGLLITANDIIHANKIARHWFDLTGEMAVVATSDDMGANAKLDRFRNSAEKCLISVKMVSEGVDISRICAVGILSACQTALFFRQLVGRGIRKQEVDPPLFECSVIAVATNENKRHAEQIESEVKVVMAEKQEREAAAAREAGERRLFTTVTSGITDVQTIVSGETVAKPDDTIIKQISDQTTAPYNLVRKVLQAAENIKSGPSGLDFEIARIRASQVSQTEPRTFEKERLSKRVNKLVGALASRTNEKHKDIHDRFNKRLGVFGKKDPSLSFEKLQQKYQWLREALELCPSS
jgi:superfamily II DNA or RNA helicase